MTKAEQTKFMRSEVNEIDELEVFEYFESCSQQADDISISYYIRIDCHTNSTTAQQVYFPITISNLKGKRGAK